MAGPARRRPPEAPTDADARAQVRHAAWRLLAACPPTRRGGAISPWCGGWTRTPDAGSPIYDGNTARRKLPTRKPPQNTAMSRYNAPPSNRTATRGRLVLWLALMALLLRALVPAGYMPDTRAPGRRPLRSHVLHRRRRPRSARR